MNERSEITPVSTDPIDYRQRLLNVARALREAPEPAAFDMSWFTHTGFATCFPCGTPRCALGHYAARRDLQAAFQIEKNGSLVVTDRDLLKEEDDGPIEASGVHFGLTPQERDQLFELHGCGDARSAEAAACFIEHFADHKFPEPTP